MGMGVNIYLGTEAVEPPEPSCVVADCGHEAYENEYLYTWENNTYCPDCMEDVIKQLPLWELVELLGGDAVQLQRRGRGE